MKQVENSEWLSYLTKRAPSVMLKNRPNLQQKIKSLQAQKNWKKLKNVLSASVIFRKSLTSQTNEIDSTDDEYETLSNPEIETLNLNSVC